MDATELGLPRYLYTETKDPDGAVTGMTIASEKLVDWAARGYGDAIDGLCRQIYDNEIDTIDAWEQNRLLLLEDRWLTLENGVDDDAHEQQYNLDCDAVAREADTRRDTARATMARRKSAIEALVLRANAHLKTRRPAPQEGNVFGYLFALAAASTLGYVLLT